MVRQLLGHEVSKYFSYILCIVFITISQIGCSVKPEIVEKNIEAILEIDIPSNFEIIESRTSGFIDMTIQYTIKYDENDFLRLIEQLDLDKWRKYNDNMHKRTYELNSSDNIYLTVDHEKFLLWYVLHKE